MVALPATEVEAACSPTCKLVARKGLFALISVIVFSILHTLFIWNIYSPSGADWNIYIRSGKFNKIPAAVPNRFPLDK